MGSPYDTVKGCGGDYLESGVMDVSVPVVESGSVLSEGDSAVRSACNYSSTLSIV